MVDVCVIGAGIIGAATAYHLSLLGAHVTVIDATHVPLGASAATFGWINANGKQPEHYFELNRAGMEEHAELARTLGDNSWLHGGGSVEWADAERIDALRARVVEHAARDYPARMIDTTRLRELEPALGPAAATHVAFFESEGWADTVALIGALLSAARKNGAHLILGARVAAVQSRSRGQAEVTTDEAATRRADVVVNCAGAEGGFLLEEVGVPIETAGPPGLNAVTAPAPIQLNRVIRAPGAHFRPETGRRVMIASVASDKLLEKGADANDLAARNIEVAAHYLPGLVGVALDEARVATRVVPQDGLPVVGRTAHAPWIYHVVTHSGVTLAPLLGRLVAAEIVNETEDSRLAPYRPARFAGSITS